MERAQKIRDICGRFRILVIGRANAGKTTILKVVCDSTEDPEIFNSQGRKIKSTVLTPSEKRGQHNIENEMVFRSNPGFIFHDSLGFEAGDTDELKKVEAFIAQRSEQTKLQDQVHAIWYCIPMDDTRPFTKAEESFFSDCGTGRVPVIAIFTKFDAQDHKAYRALRNEEVPIENAGHQAALRAEQECQPVLNRIYESRYGPKSHVYLRDMHKPKAQCDELMEKTASTLNDEVLKLLFVSTQRNNLKLCIEHALTRDIMREIVRFGKTQTLDKHASNVGSHGMKKDDIFRVHCGVMLWFPHIVVNDSEHNPCGMTIS
ncbi:hypothetical protein BD410DRAFT_788518 [Rickenella mellea]|uniref:G domain-containing protein n=1 Tax=Rickenella mellea TaxID=50990 RepID=A0A4Y7Q644_9AGAM|nr:hypothetical protein BD410DRAFT_788518 [Rickenella mellea]